MAKFLPMLVALVFLTACSKRPAVKSNVDLETLVKGKSQSLPDRHEAIPNTYFELTAWTADPTKNPPTVASATGTLGSGSQVACASASEKNGAANTGHCEITIAGEKFKLKARDIVTLGGTGEVSLTCTGDGPAFCRALVVN